MFSTYYRDGNFMKIYLGVCTCIKLKSNVCNFKMCSATYSSCHKKYVRVETQLVYLLKALFVKGNTCRGLQKFNESLSNCSKILI